MELNDSAVHNQSDAILRDNSFNNLKELNDDTISLLTYNIFLRPPLIKNNKDDMKNERLSLFLEAMGEFDVICLQEVFGFLNFRKTRLIEESQRHGFYHFAESKDTNCCKGAFVDGGLMILSKKPIVYQNFQSYDNGVLSDSIANKGGLYTKILQKSSQDGEINHYLHVFNTHLQASYVGEEENVRRTVITRVKQLYQFKKFIDQMLQEQGYDENKDVCIVAGDFNVDALNAEYPVSYLQKSEYSYLIERLNLSNKVNYREYDIMFGILSNFNQFQVVDTLKASHNNQSQITFADVQRNDSGKIITDEKGKEIPRETVLTCADDHSSKQSLDYILHYTPKFNQDKNRNDKILKHKLQYVQGSSKVQPFFTNTYYKDHDITVTQMSDHYGVSCQVKYTEKSDNKIKVIQ